MSYTIDTLTKRIGFISAILALILALLIGYDAMMRYLFSEGSIALQEIEWHLFDVVCFMLLEVRVYFRECEQLTKNKKDTR